MSQTQTLEIVDIPVDRIRPSPFQPRLAFDLEELRGSIIQYGIRDPLKVRKVGDHYEIIDGERRWRIAEQEGMKTVPCLVLKYTDEEADALSWRFNTERKDYSLEERAKHFKKHQEQGMSGIGIGRIHGYSQQQVNRLLAIFRLPEKYQNYLWAGEFAYQKYEYLYDKGVLNAETFPYGKDVIEIIDEAVERNLTQREFENVVDDYLSDLEKRKVEEAKKVATQLEVSKKREEKAREALGEPEVTPPETPEDFERAAEALRKEAERRKTPEQILEEKQEKARKFLLIGKGSILSKVEKAKELGINVSEFEKKLNELKAKIAKEPDAVLKEAKGLKAGVDKAIKAFKEEETKRRLEEEARLKVEQELLTDEKFLKKAAELAPPASLELEEQAPIRFEEMKPAELQEVRERWERLQEEIKETLARPEVKERGELFMNWLAHGAFVKSLGSARCPICLKESIACDWKNLVWKCHDLNLEEAYKIASEEYRKSMRRGEG